MIFLIYALTAVAVLTEKGYIYSVGQKKYVTSSNDNIFLEEENRTPKMFEMEEVPNASSGNLFVYPYPRDGTRVMDMNLSGSRLIYLHPKHGNWNQQIEARLVGKGMIKLKVGSYCIGIENSKLHSTTCKTSEADENQLFKWIPERRSSYGYNSMDNPENPFADKSQNPYEKKKSRWFERLPKFFRGLSKKLSNRNSFSQNDKALGYPYYTNDDDASDHIEIGGTHDVPILITGIASMRHY